MAPRMSLVAGAWVGAGCTAAELGKDCAGRLPGGLVLAAKIPLCRRQGWVGSVPDRNGNVAIRGHAGVARPPVVGSIVAIVMPGGGGPNPNCGCRTDWLMN
jgi:hypothetical protein